MDISIVIPVYNESGKITADLETIAAFFYSNPLSGEIIIADDGSTDDTIQVIEKSKSVYKMNISVIKNKHFGKGFAVKTGIMKAIGDMIMFIDSGNCVPYSDVIKGIMLIKDGQCDIAHGSRYLPDSRIIKPKVWTRKLLSFLFRKFIYMHMDIPSFLTDTQCGLKIYRKDVAHHLYSECTSQGFLFDIEVILRAQKYHYIIKEFPIQWSSDPDSRLAIFQSFPEILKELIWIKRKLTTY